MQKDNKTHRMLGTMIKMMEGHAGARIFYYEQLTLCIYPWYKRLLMSFFHRPIYPVRGLFERLSEDKVFQGKVGEFDSAVSHEDLYRIRNAYGLEDYKVPIKWWEELIRFAIAVGGLGGLITATIGALDSRQAPILRDSIGRQTQRIESLVRRIERDSITLDSIRDLLKKQENDSLKNPS
jgi:hypothetical protein